MPGAKERRKREERKKTRTRYDEIMDGEREPEGQEKGWTNLEEGHKRHNFAVIDTDKQKEISRKGAAAVNKMFGEKKTARESLENILTLKATDEIIAGADLPPEIAERLKRSNPDATIYDLIQLVATGRAVRGNMKAYELIRDTYGDKPIERVEVTDNVMTAQDREMLQIISERLQNAESVQIVEAEQREKEAKRE